MTGHKPSHDGRPTNGDSGSAGRLEIGAPVVADGSALYRITRESGTLDVNSRYAYLLWCRDFSDTSAVARVDGAVVGFVTGFIRPDAANTMVVWQIAVDPSQRGGGVATKLLNHLTDRLVSRGVRYLETTITPDNSASIKLFSTFASSASARFERDELFTTEMLGGAHAPEDLYRIGPLREAAAAA